MEKSVYKWNDFSFNSIWFVLNMYSRYIYILGRKINLFKKNINFNLELIDILIWKELLVVKINMIIMF